MTDGAPLKDPKLAAKVRQLKDRLATEGTWTLVDRHDFGKAVREVRDGETKHGRGGHDRRATALLARRLGKQPDFLNKHVRFAAWLTRKEAAKLDGRHLPNGNPVSWSHVRAVLAVDDPNRRWKLLEQAIEGGWSSGRLGEAVRQAMGGKSSGGGRKPVVPRDLAGLVGQMRQAAEEFANRSRWAWSRGTSLTEMAGALEPAQITKELVERLQELREKLLGALKEARKREAEAGRVLANLQGKLTSRRTK